MAIYDLGTASLAANGEVTGVGTTWKAPLTLIRVGATIVFKTEPVQIYTISEIISDTQINVYNPNSETVPAGTGYAILAHDGITVQGLAQDVAETLRYYQSQESYVAQAVDAFANFDANDFDTKVTQVNTQYGEVVTIGSQVSSDANQVAADKNDAAASAESATSSQNSAAESAYLAQQIANQIASGSSYNYSQLRSYDGELTLVYVNGAESFGDGGQGYFYRIEPSSTDSDNGATVINDSLGRSWYRVYSGDVDFMWWKPDLSGNTDHLSDLNVALSIAASKGVYLNLPKGTIGVSDEVVISSGMKISGAGSSLVSSRVNATTIKWIGETAQRKSVIRCSSSAISVTPTKDVSSVVIKNIVADGNNRAPTGFYFRYFTNDSYCDNIAAVNTRIVGIAIYQSWFFSMGTIVAHENYGRGIVIGFPTQGEVDDLAVNSANFLRIRTHSNGRNGDFSPEASSPTRYSGAGLITRCSGCTFSNIQSEKNMGFGWIETSVRSGNNYGSYYTEFNGVTDGSNGYGFLSPDEVGVLKSVTIQNVTLYSREAFINEADTPVTIFNFTKALDAFNSVFSGNGGFRISGGNGVAAIANQSDSTFAQNIYAIPYLCGSSGFNTKTASSLKLAGSFPSTVTSIIVEICFVDPFPGGDMDISLNGTVIAYFKEPARSAGYVLRREVAVSEVSSFYLTCTRSTVASDSYATASVYYGRLNNGDVTKKFLNTR